MHHEYYDETNPIEGTAEICDSCHTNFHNTQRKRAINQGLRSGWNEKGEPPLAKTLREPITVTEK
jgi:hypothetical protein